MPLGNKFSADQSAERRPPSLTYKNGLRCGRVGVSLAASRRSRSVESRSSGSFLTPSTHTDSLKMELLHLAVVLIFVSSSSAQIPYLGDCPTLSPMENFNISRFMGIWYEAERYFQIYQMGGRCVSLEYLQDGDDYVKTISRQKSLVSGTYSETVLRAIRVEKGHASGMFFSYPYFPMDLPYTILDTDYKDFAVAWSCNSLRFANIRNAWILTRERHPSVGVMENAYSVLDLNGISRAFFYRTDQNNCPDVEESKNSTVTNTHDPQTRHGI
ncbi:hypothetical protein GE061_011809 [Apolygus lucorum]|uniref:Lipocalin/cytosolic fatty-acid binding domain-containing protein n=1 Tax=Apolygus lucorum TaxID=248454 RepID=A0A8S9Y0M5_APOLU|nr:hypothetical protein GE061_011809 [Apolygus lucorum]